MDIQNPDHLAIWFWTKSQPCKSDKERGIDRIKRSVLKNKFSEGGLNITDMECLNRSLKLRQFIRASKINHPICRIQKYCVEKLGYSNVIMQEYLKISNLEIVKSSQETINYLCDHTRSVISNNSIEASGDYKSSHFIGTTNISIYLLRNKKRMINCMFGPIKNEGIDTLSELCSLSEFEPDMNQIIRIGNVIATFPQHMIELAGSYDEDLDSHSTVASQFLMDWDSWIDITNISTKLLFKFSLVLVLVKC